MRKIIITLMLPIILLLNSCGGGTGIDFNMIPFKKDGKTIYVDQSGAIVLELDSIDGSLFSDGLALATNSHGKGFINKKGEFVIKPEYKKGLSFREGIAWVVKENGFPEAINRKGEILFSLKQARSVYSFNEGLAVFTVQNEDGKTLYGCIDKSGKIVLEPQVYVLSESFGQGKVAIRNDNYKYGYMDKSGKIVINCQFDKALGFGENKLACVELGDKWGVINHKGEYVINPRFESILPDGDWFMIVEDSKAGWIDDAGQYVINPQFKMALLFNNSDLAPVAEDRKKWGYINRAGILLSGYPYERASSFIDNKLAVVALNEAYGFINKEEKYIVNPQYSSVDQSFLMSIVPSLMENQQIFTDYLDIDVIVNKVNALFDVNAGVVAGVSYRSTVSELMTDYQLTEASFSKKGSSTEIKKGNLPEGITYSLKMNGNPWVVSPGSWFSTYTLNRDFVAPSYSMFIKLDYLHYSKTRQLASAIFKALSGGLEFYDVEDGYECRTNNNLGVSYKEGEIFISAYNYTLLGDDPMIDMDYVD